MEITEIIVTLTPIVVFLAAQLIKLVKGAIPGYVITVFIVPLLSLGYTALSQLVVSPEISIWLQLGYGLAAVFVYELYKDFTGKK